MEISETSNHKKVFKSLHSQTLVTFMQGVLEMINFSIMSRILSKQDFGYFALLTAVTVVLASLTEAGIGSAVIQKKNPDSDFVSTSFSLSLTLGIVFGSVLLFGAPLFSEIMVGGDTLKLAFQLMSISIFLQGYNNVYNSLMVRHLDFMKLGLYRTGSMLIAYIVGIILALNGFGFYAIVVTGILNHLFYTVILQTANRKVRLRYHFEKNKIKEIFGYGGRLTLTVIIRNITEQVDRLVVARYLSVSSVGLLNRPGGLINTISNKINGIFDTILFPILSSIQDNPQKINNAFKKSLGLVFLFSIVLCSCVILGWKYIITIFFGNQWESIKTLLWIFGTLLLFTGLNRIFDCFFRSLALMRMYLIIRIINCVLTIGCVIFGCHWGVMGVAVAKLICEAVSCNIKFGMLRAHTNCSARDLVMYMYSNCKGMFVLSILGILIMTFSPFGEYYSIFIYLILFVAIGITHPSVFGALFTENIYNRYLENIATKLRIK